MRHGVWGDSSACGRAVLRAGTGLLLAEELAPVVLAVAFVLAAAGLLLSAGLAAVLLRLGLLRFLEAALGPGLGGGLAAAG